MTAGILDVPEADVHDALGSTAAGAAVDDGRIRFAHDLLRDAFVAALPARQRELLHVAAAGAVVGDGVDEAVRRAHHA